MSGPSLDLSFSARDHIVRAGAGAGKTYNLVECVVSAYRHFRARPEGAKKLPRFVLTTFTKKATQELRERMVLKACEMEDPEFFQFVTDPGHLMISTIHGVLGQFLKEFGHLFEMDLSFKILEGDEERHLMESIVRELLISEPGHLEVLKDFNFSKLVMMLKAFHGALGKRAELRPPSFDEVWAHTQEFVEYQKEGLILMIDRGLEEVGDESYRQALMSIREFIDVWELDVELEIPSLPRKTKKENFPVDFHEDMKKALEKFKKALDEILISPDVLENLTAKWEQFFELGVKYSEQVEAAKIKGGFVTLSDLENQAARVLKKSPFLGRIFSENFDFWLIDEFQDTSSHQLDILNQLIGDRPRFVVGDPQQSIYLFRGAESQLFAAEWARITGTEGRGSLLEVNYRSQKDLLLFFNDLMKQVPQFAPMVPKHQDPAREPVACLMEAADLEDELRALYERAIELCGASQKWDEICVLGRTHDDLFKVATYLKSKGIPTHVHSPEGYFKRREVQDALSIYKFLVNPHDNLNLLQVLRAPWLRVSDEKLARWMKTVKVSLWGEILSRPDVDESAVQLLKAALLRTDEFGLLRTFTDLLSAVEFIEKSSAFDPSGRVEANIWKLVSKLKEVEQTPGSHPLDILGQLTQESDAVAATEPNCVNLMTIHGSKGLEFDHVFFPRLGRRFQFTKRGGLAFSPDSGRFVFSLKDEDSESLVSSLEREWINQQKEKEKQEVERWFYVALTRAKRSVTLSWSQKEFASDSWVSIFNLREFESPAMERRSGPFQERLPLESAQATLEPRPRFESAQEIVEEEQVVRASFTRISSHEPEAWTHRGLKNKFSAQAKGIHWHRLFEGVRYKDLDQGLKEFPFLDAMKTPPFKEILRHGHVEWGFQSKVGPRILEGQVDLWGYDADGNLWVVDYKTGSSQDPEKAILQVKFYLWILRKRGLENPRMKTRSFNWAVIYPLEEKVLHGKMTDAEFAELEIKLSLAE